MSDASSPESGESSGGPAAGEAGDTSEARPKRFLIGSQRYGVRPLPALPPLNSPESPPEVPAATANSAAIAPVTEVPAAVLATVPPVAPAAVGANVEPSPAGAETAEESSAPDRRGRKGNRGEGRRSERKVPTIETFSPTVARPSKREQSAELDAEIAEALGEISLDLLVTGREVTAEIPPDSHRQGRIVSVHHDDVFVELGGRDQGVLSLRQFEEPPEPGTIIEVVVGRFDAEEGLYSLRLPGGAIEVGDWSELAEGVVVEVRVTGHNKGGLECEVNRIRGFIPAGQIAPYRVEDFSQYVGERLTCVVTEASRERRNLVLSRRAVLEREQAAAKEKLLAELAPGQSREGIVRSVRDFGAFVDLGGVDGLVHVSQMSWQRIKHPSELLEVGQRVKVKVQKIDPDTGKISLSLRDLVESPWATAAQKYPTLSRVQGVVTKIMDFGAFVQLEPGIEGLVHVSELAHQRVWRPSDIVEPGQEVEVKVLSIDPEAQRMSLSIKACLGRPEPAAKPDEMAADEASAETPEPPRKPKSTAHLKGGIGRGSGGDQFGLRW